MVQLLADWQGPPPCCGLLTCWSAAESAWQCCLSYACTNKLECVSDRLREDMKQTENGPIRYAGWDLLTRANTVKGHCIHDWSYRVHHLYHRRARASKTRHKPQGISQPKVRLQVLVLKIQQCTCNNVAAAAGGRRQQCDPPGGKRLCQLGIRTLRDRPLNSPHLLLSFLLLIGNQLSPLQWHPLGDWKLESQW